MFWDDGTLSGKGKDEQGDYTISGKVNLFTRLPHFVLGLKHKLWMFVRSRKPSTENLVV